MGIKQFDIWIADLEPQRGTETGKVRPVLIIQTNLLKDHPSTVICPIMTNVAPDSDNLRVMLIKELQILRETLT
jgi:mRNA interferase MazF